MELSLLLMEKILSMACMALVGWVAAKTGVIRQGGAAVLSAFCLYIICPCVNIVAFQVDRAPDTQTGLLVTLAAAVGVHLTYLLLTGLLAKPCRLDAVEQGSLIYSNAGNLIIPLVTALLGREKILYACAFRVIQTPLMWVHYPRLLRPEAKTDWLKLLRNPNILSVGAGLFLFFSGLRLPGIVSGAVESISDCMGPVSMFNIGLMMAEIDWGILLGSVRSWLIALGRLVLYPLVFILLTAATGVTARLPGAGEWLLITLLACAAPVAVNVAQMAEISGGDGPRAGAVVALSTLLSILTMPLMALLYQIIC